MAKYVYSFGPTGTDGDASMKDLLGGKGANLAEMSQIGLARPAGLHHRHRTSAPTTTSTARPTRPNWPPRSTPPWRRSKRRWARQFGSTTDPLLVSCRSGARESMPGMMDTVLNIGLNDKTVEALAKKSGNERFAWDSYRRFVQMYGDVVLGHEAQDEERHRSVRRDSRSQEEGGRRQARQRTLGRRSSRNWSPSSRRPSRRAPARTSPSRRWSRSGARSAPSSAAG